MKKLFNTKFKKFLWLAILIIAILSASLLRIVPNYANKYGFEIVHLWDYNKYNQGYCLAENRILDKKELYTRVIKDFIEKEIMIWKNVWLRLDNEYGYNYGMDFINETHIELVEAFDNSNWFEFLSQNYVEGKLYEISKIKQINNPMDYLVIDLENGTAGFSKPIFIKANLYLDKSFILFDNGYAYLNSIHFYKEPTKYDQKEYYDNIKNRDKYDLNREKDFDNCGITGINVEESINIHVLSTVQGG